MLSDQQLIDLAVAEPSWEDVIVKIVAEEGMDPWDIDLIRLADTFSAYLARIEQLDLRIPARFILIAAILLRIKSDILAKKRQKILIPEPETQDSELLRTLATIPPLQPPLKRIPLGNVTLNELITALRKAFEVRERRERRKARVRLVVKRAVPPEEADITERIGNLLTAIQAAIADLEGNVTFSKLVKRWERQEIVDALVPLLHLSQDGMVSISQPKLFDEIYVKLIKNEAA
jgi:segregation and condensation protein A